MSDPSALSAVPACGCHGCGAPQPAATSKSAAPLPWWRGRAGLVLACAVLLAAAEAASWRWPALPEWIVAPALLLGGVPVARQALAAVRVGRVFSIEMLMSMAVLGALVLGAWGEAAMVVVLFQVGEALEGLAAGRARAGIRALTAMLPAQARRRQGQAWMTVAADSLRPGDVVQVRPGDRLPVDGTLMVGSGDLDESAVSGESVPVGKRPGDSLFAGTLCLDGVLEVRAEADARDNTLTRVARMVEQAQSAKAPFARFVDRFARWYTPAVVVVAALVMAAPPLLAGQDWAVWTYRGLALLLIGCPCALVISTPAAIAAALAAGARRGVLIKGGAVLERLAEVDLVALDKTGTLTEGKPEVTDLAAPAGDESGWLAVAAGLAEGSTHPLARAVAVHAAGQGVGAAAIDDARALPGRGVGGSWRGRAVFLGALTAAADRAATALAGQWADEGKTVTALTVDGQVVLLLGLRDRLRGDAAVGIAALRALGIDGAVLSGDRHAAAQAVGRELGLRVHAPLLPAEKLAQIRAWQDQGAVVAKIGDGINDAPALAAADVGIAMGDGSDIALETADAALLHGRVGDVAAALLLARRGKAVIRQNVALALGLKAAFLVSTVLGLTGLWPAVLADTGATVLVTANALRLLRFNPPPG